MEAYVSRYGGLVLYTREMDEKAYAKICAVSKLVWKHDAAAHVGSIDLLLRSERFACQGNQPHDDFFLGPFEESSG